MTDKQKAQIELAGRTAEMAHRFDPCWLPYHRSGCCYAAQGTRAFHVDAFPTYAENEAMARMLVRKRAQAEARREMERAEIETARRVAQRVAS